MYKSHRRGNTYYSKYHGQNSNVTLANRRCHDEEKNKLEDKEYKYDSCNSIITLNTIKIGRFGLNYQYKKLVVIYWLVTMTTTAATNTVTSINTAACQKQSLHGSAPPATSNKNDERKFENKEYKKT